MMMAVSLSLFIMIIATYLYDLMMMMMMMMMMIEEEECFYTKYSMVFAHISFSISLRYGATKHKPLDT